MPNQSGEQIGYVSMSNLRQKADNRSRYFLVAKALQDKVLAVIALIMLWPLMLAIAVGIKLSAPGPVFFLQRRHGLGCRDFYVIKFRSTRVHDENSTRNGQAAKHDGHVTRFGKLLRRTGLDGLPQIFNVLVGSMSIVGPRSHTVQHNTHYQKLINNYMHCHDVKPGITGWAQVNGFSRQTPELCAMKKRIQYDLDYIRYWSLWLDIRIIVLTAMRMLGQKET